VSNPPVQKNRLLLVIFLKAHIRISAKVLYGFQKNEKTSQSEKVYFFEREDYSRTCTRKNYTSFRIDLLELIKLNIFKNLKSPVYKTIYNFTPFICELNEMESDVAPTDSRLRPDIRAMEDGDWDQADKLMHSLEVKYVAKKKTEPIWFEMKKNPITNEKMYVLKNGDNKENYWQCKKRNDWNKSPLSFFKY
jgi:hypothetical protein